MVFCPMSYATDGSMKSINDMLGVGDPLKQYALLDFDTGEEQKF